MRQNRQKQDCETRLWDKSTEQDLKSWKKEKKKKRKEEKKKKRKKEKGKKRRKEKKKKTIPNCENEYWFTIIHRK